jgi:16S rRNA (uracil1498-N3)-methyltransferase
LSGDSKSLPAAFLLADLNLILFDRAELPVPLPRTDRRSLHLLETLHRHEGDFFDAGIIDGPRGKGKLVRMSDEALFLEFTWKEELPLNDPFTLIVGLPRPQTARDILREGSALGIQELHFVTTEKGEPNYGQSSLWRNNEWYRQLVLGAEQAFCTRLPRVTFERSLFDVVSNLPTDGVSRIALDNYESDRSLSEIVSLKPSVTLAVGPERGWSAAERDELRRCGFELLHLGPRVLRTETACIAAIAILKAKNKWI